MMDAVWPGGRAGDPRALALYRRHYSCYQYRDGRHPTRFAGPGERLGLLTPECNALLVWRKFRDAGGQVGVNCAVFRNAGPQPSSDFLRAGMARAWARWPGTR